MRVESSIKNISSGLVLQATTLVLGFISRTFFIKILGVTYLGTNGLFSNILSLLSLAELGIGQAITFNLYKPIAEGNNDKICALMNFYKKFYRIVFLFVLSVGLLLTPFLKIIINSDEVIPNLELIYIMYVINSAASYLFIYRSTLVIASQKTYILNKIEYLFSIVATIAQISVLLLTKNYIVYLATQILTTITQNIIIAIKSNKLFPYLKNSKTKLEAEDKSSLIKDIKALLLYKVGTLALNSTDNILISFFVGIKKIGLYSNYTLITTSISKILNTVFNSLIASIGNFNAIETNKRKVEMFKIVNMSSYWLYGVCSICFFCVANSFIVFWVGEEYLLGLRELFVITVNMYIGGMLFAPTNYRQTMGLFVYGKYRPIISAIINLGASIILGSFLGLEGILLGTIIARLTTNAWFDPYIIFKKGFGISPSLYFYDYLLKAAVFFITMLLCYILTMIIPYFSFSFILKGIVSFVVSNLIFLIVFGKSNEIRYLFSILKQLLSKHHNRKTI